MECRLCKYLIFVFLAIKSNFSQAQCGDEEYINWMGKIVQEKKQKIGGFASLIPTSLAVAQSALETGYGKSYSARKRNNHFGLSPGGKLASFSSPRESVRYYLETLSFHNAYESFRRLIEKGEDNPFELIKPLAKVYAEDKSYAQQVKYVIKSCNLERFDVI